MPRFIVDGSGNIRDLNASTSSAPRAAEGVTSGMDRAESTLRRRALRRLSRDGAFDLGIFLLALTCGFGILLFLISYLRSKLGYYSTPEDYFDRIVFSYAAFPFGPIFLLLVIDSMPIPTKSDQTDLMWVDRFNWFKKVLQLLVFLVFIYMGFWSGLFIYVWHWVIYLGDVVATIGVVSLLYAALMRDEPS